MTIFFLILEQENDLIHILSIKLKLHFIFDGSFAGFFVLSSYVVIT